MPLASRLFRSSQRRSRARTGAKSLACWQVEQRNGRIFVHEKRERRKPSGKAQASAPDRVVIVGGGAAGFATAEMLRRREFRGSIVMLSSDAAAPIDRPNLSKDYLVGSAPEDWMPLRPDSFYSESGIELRLNSEVTGIDIKPRHVVTAGGGKVAYDRSCWPPARSLYASRFRASTSRIFIRCVRWPIAAPSLARPNERAACS